MSDQIPFYCRAGQIESFVWKKKENLLKQKRFPLLKQQKGMRLFIMKLESLM